jgi:eukaryotic-like serine/threonine-protein kinase
VAQDIGTDRRIARLVGGRYEITGLIASGGMGEVFQARDRTLDRIVALKVLRAGVASDPDFIERFRREATAAGRLSHPNIVQVYDWGRGEDGSAYMAMEYVEGQNLREVIVANGKLGPAIAARIATQVCAALEHARRAGLVHRDVKPENILVTPDGRVKVADFGLSRTMAESRATQAGVVLGTAHYLAPEQVEGKESDHRADLYALGIVVYEMLTGETPFTGDNPVVIAYQRVRQDVPLPSGRVNGIPPGLDEVVRRSTARDPSKRFASGAEMAEALRASVPRSDTGEIGALVHPTTAIPIASQETITLKARRGPRITRRGLIVVGAVLVLLLASIPILVGQLARAEVPTVTNMTKAQAQSALQKAGFKVGQEFENHATVGEGLVIRTDPPAGESARKGSTVTLVLSQGPVKVTVPNVRGKPYAEAESTLKGLGLLVTRVDAFHNSVAKDLVIDQDKDPDTIVAQGKTVTLTVSKGKERVTVPDVRNKPEAEAMQMISAAGLTATVQRAFNETVPSGVVISQSPEPNAKADKGTAITIVVSSGPPNVAAPNIRCKTRTQAADIATSNGLKIRFEGNDRFVVDQQPAPGTQVPRGSTLVAYMGPGNFC